MRVNNELTLRGMDLLAPMATFVRVVDAQSLSAAARALRLSLPAVSRQLSALESELGASLIVRSTRKLHVTNAGREWYQRCIRGTHGVRGTLVVSASLTFGFGHVVRWALSRKEASEIVDVRGRTRTNAPIALRGRRYRSGRGRFIAPSFEGLRASAPFWMR